MALNRTAGVNNGHFSGSGKVFSRDASGLSEIVKGLLVRDAAVRIEAESITGLTDSSGGTAGASIAAATIPVTNDLTGLTTGCTAASFDISTLDVEDAYATLLGQANLVLAEISGGSVVKGDGTDGSGTVGAIDVVTAANSDNTDALTYDSSRAIFQQLLDNQATTTAVVDLCRVAVGLAKTTEATGGGSQQVIILSDATNGPLSVGSVNAGANGADATAAVLKAAVDAQLVILANNVALLCDQLDAVTDISEATVQKPSNYAGEDR